MDLYSGWRQVVSGARRRGWRSQIRIRARLDRNGSVQGKAVAAGHAPHPVVDGTRTPHLLPTVRMRIQMLWI